MPPRFAVYDVIDSRSTDAKNCGRSRARTPPEPMGRLDDHGHGFVDLSGPTSAAGAARTVLHLHRFIFGSATPRQIGCLIFRLDAVLMRGFIAGLWHSVKCGADQPMYEMLRGRNTDDEVARLPCLLPQDQTGSGATPPVCSAANSPKARRLVMRKLRYRKPFFGHPAIRSGFCHAAARLRASALGLARCSHFWTYQAGAPTSASCRG